VIKMKTVAQLAQGRQTPLHSFLSGVPGMLQLADAGLMGVAWLVDTGTHSGHRSHLSDIRFLMMRNTLSGQTLLCLDDRCTMADDTSPQ